MVRETARIQRKAVPQSPSRREGIDHIQGLGTPLLALSALLIVNTLFVTLPWARRWVLSGAAVETLLVIYGHSLGTRIIPDVPLWTILTTFNLAYAICSTSWLLYGLFTSACYPCILFTCLFQFTAVANLARRTLRKTLRQLHFINDKIALFNLPALEIDQDVDGLLVIRGITISLSSLSIVAHGIELGLKLADNIELAMYADEVTIRLFRRIEIGDVYANAKGGESEMTFASLEDPTDDDVSEVSVLMEDTPLLRAATIGSEGFKDRPKLRESLTGVSYMKDSSAQASLESVKTLSPDDDIATKQYHSMLTEIRTTSAVYQSRQHVKQTAKGENGFNLETDKDMRAAICAELHALPSIVHPPERSVRVTTLRNLSPPRVRNFMHRLPFLLRMLLAPLSYFHPITVSSINAAGSGTWLSALLQEKVFKSYPSSSFELRKLERRVSAWLAKANFSMQLAGIRVLAQVPFSANFDITTQLKLTDIMAYRTVPESGTLSQVLRLGGANATFTIPSFLLPHHEHIVPPKPTEEDEHNLEIQIEEADGLPKTVQKEQELEKTRKDETEITMSVHASLPAAFDQSLLNFVAALVKATKMIEVEKEVDEVAQEPDNLNLSRASTFDSGVSMPSSPTSIAPTSPTSPTKPTFKSVARNIRQNLKESTATANIKEVVRDLRQNTVDGMKNMRTTIVGGMVNDRWIAKLVGRVAATLQKAQGDVGYSGAIPIPLAPYRGEDGLESKLLP